MESIIQTLTVSTLCKAFVAHCQDSLDLLGYIKVFRVWYSSVEPCAKHWQSTQLGAGLSYIYIGSRF
jgi:hypothetical protein